jgi:Ca2+-binding RTX toxin-like protein
LSGVLPDCDRAVTRNPYRVFTKDGDGTDEDEKGGDMERVVKIFLVAALVVVLSAGAALAASPIIGTDADEQIAGTKKPEKIRGLGGEDEITDGLGKDLVYGGDGADNLIGYGGDTSVDRFYGGTGKDTVQSRDVPAAKDRVRCGPGFDRVYADRADVVSEDCERVRAQ